MNKRTGISKIPIIFVSRLHIMLFGSLALNILLFGFIFGRSSPFLFHPPWGPRFADGVMSLPPPPPGIHHFGPPPLFGPDALFNPDEMRDAERRFSENFDQINALRHQFGARLESGPVTKEEALKHFADIDQIVAAVQKEAQEKAASKLASMSPEERQRFASFLSDHARPPDPP